MAFILFKFFGDRMSFVHNVMILNNKVISHWQSIFCFDFLRHLIS